MFGNVIYYDKKKIDEYKSLITQQKNLQIDEYEISNDKGLQIDLKAIGADAKASKTYKAKVLESLLYNCDEFEKMLDGRDDFFDFTQLVDFDIATIGRGGIIKFEGYMKVPEEFDIIQTIEKFKPLAYTSMINENMDEPEQAALNMFLDVSNAKIPIVIDFEESLMCSKLISDNMLINYEELEDYEDLEVSIIARITSNKLINMEKSFYDPLKDFIALNRAMRRGMGSRDEGMNELFVDNAYRTIEILAIYQ